MHEALSFLRYRQTQSFWPREHTLLSPYPCFVWVVKRPKAGARIKANPRDMHFLSLKTSFNRSQRKRTRVQSKVNQNIKNKEVDARVYRVCVHLTFTSVTKKKKRTESRNKKPFELSIDAFRGRVCTYGWVLRITSGVFSFTRQNPD